MTTHSGEEQWLGLKRMFQRPNGSGGCAQLSLTNWFLQTQTLKFPKFHWVMGSQSAGAYADHQVESESRYEYYMYLIRLVLLRKYFINLSWELRWNKITQFIKMTMLSKWSDWSRTQYIQNSSPIQLSLAELNTSKTQVKRYYNLQSPNAFSNINQHCRINCYIEVTNWVLVGLIRTFGMLPSGPGFKPSWYQCVWVFPPPLPNFGKQKKVVI